LLNCHRNIIWLGCFNKAGTLLRPQVARKNPGAFAQNLGGAGDSDWPSLNDDEMANDEKLPPASRA
jgi:hypothetical protein